MSFIQTFLFSKLILSCIVAFCVTGACIILLKPIAIKIKLQDWPGGRKQHKHPTPLIGGVGMFTGFCFALLTLAHSMQAYRGFLGASALLMFVGILDDMRELSPKARFIGQILASALMIFWGGNVLQSFGNLIFAGDLRLVYLAIPITIFATVGAINAVNMLDGVDGLLGTVALTQFIFLAYLATQVSDVISYAMIVLIIAVLLAYLAFNFPFRTNKPADIFMGDAGSMFLGFALTWFMISLSQTHRGNVAPVTMLWMFALPLFDTTWLLIKRTLRQSNPLAPGRDHLHHLLQFLGLSDRAICLCLGMMTGFLGLIGIAALNYSIDQSTQFVSFVGLFLVYCLSVNFTWNYMATREWG